MKCPVCETVDLVPTDRQNIEIDYCPKCRGVWLDRGELDKIIERSAAAEYGSGRGAAPTQPSSQPMPDKRKNDYFDTDMDIDLELDNRRRSDPRWRDDDDDDHHRTDSRRYDDDYRKQGKPYKKKSILGEIFDIFD